DLTETDAVKSHRAMRFLVAAPEQAMTLLREKLRPIAGPDPKLLARLIADLDAGRFAVREQATRELEKLGALARPALRQALDGQPSGEVRRRVERLLERLESSPLSGEELRVVRAIEVLERIGTTDARGLLERMAREGPDPSLRALGAGAALERL